MDKKKLIISIVFLLLIIISIFGIIFCVKYYFHRIIKITSDYEISSISWHLDNSTEEIIENSNNFTHVAGYGRFYYKFNLIYEDSIIPIEISIFKPGNHDHDSIGLEFLRGSSDSEIIINVTGAYNYTETINIYDDRTCINIGP